MLRFIGTLALHTLTGLAGCDTGCSSEHHLVADHLGLLRVLLEIVGQGLAHGLLNGTSDLRVSKLGLGLTFELRLCHLDANHCCKAFTEVLWGNLNLGLLNLLGDLRVVVSILLQRAGEGGTDEDN